MKYIILVSMIAANLVEQPTPIIRISSGLLRGTVSDNGEYFQYLGIPYAAVSASNRFKGPLPPPKWDGILEARDLHVQCFQKRILDEKFLGEEDCLRINIFTPVNRDSHEYLPVMVFIHGGAFLEGSGSPHMYGPDYFIRQDVILVTFNYRLDILGFLCLGIEEAPGNAGMKDQVAALKWIQENIKSFGGDPTNITLFGESAGAASVSYHLLSPMSKGLFHRVIQQSGSALSPWAFQLDPLKVALDKAQSLGYDGVESPKNLYKFFANKSSKELIMSSFPKQSGSHIIMDFMFSPCVENVIKGIKPFLTDSPYRLLSQGMFHEVPRMIGHTSQEGYLFVGVDIEKKTDLNNIDLSKGLPKDLHFSSDVDRTNQTMAIKQFYFDDNEIGDRTKVALSTFLGDAFFSFPSILETNLVLQTSLTSIYNYVFSYDGFLNVPKMLFGFGKEPGATHVDDLAYLFKPRFFPHFTKWLEPRVIDQMITLWTNFAKYGVPTPEATDLLPLRWSMTDRRNPTAFVIDKQLSTTTLLDKPSVVLWNKTYNTYRRDY